MFISEKLVRATEDYVRGGSWEAFHAVLESDFYFSSCGGACKPCSREQAARQLIMMHRQRAQYA